MSVPCNKGQGGDKPFIKYQGFMQMTQLQLTKISAINFPVFNTLFFKKGSSRLNPIC